MPTTSYRTVRLEVSERIKVSLKYPGNSKVILAMFEDDQPTSSTNTSNSHPDDSGAIVLELEPVSQGSSSRGSPQASAKVETESSNDALVWRNNRPPNWRTPGLYERKRCNDVAAEEMPPVEVINFPTLTSPTRSTSRT